MTILNKETVLNALRAAVEKYGFNHTAICHYVVVEPDHTITPTCIAAVALEPLIGIEAVAKLEFGDPNDPDGEPPFGPFNEQLPENFEALTGHELTEDAYWLLASVQFWQDNNKTWGIALRKAENG